MPTHRTNPDANQVSVGIDMAKGESANVSCAWRIDADGTLELMSVSPVPPLLLRPGLRVNKLTGEVKHVAGSANGGLIVDLSCNQITWDEQRSVAVYKGVWYKPWTWLRWRHEWRFYSNGEVINTGTYYKPPLWQDLEDWEKLVHEKARWWLAWTLIFRGINPWKARPYRYSIKFQRIDANQPTKGLIPNPASDRSNP